MCATHMSERKDVMDVQYCNAGQVFRLFYQRPEKELSRYAVPRYIHVRTRDFTWNVHFVLYTGLKEKIFQLNDCESL